MIQNLLLLGMLVAVCFGGILLFSGDGEEQQKRRRSQSLPETDALRAEIDRLQARIEVLESLAGRTRHPE